MAAYSCWSEEVEVGKKMFNKILVADDDATTLMILESTVSAWGYEVVVARDGIEVLAVLAGYGPPRLLLLDWMMPGYDGPSLCRSVRANRDLVGSYIIMLSSRGAKDDMVEALDAGADDYLVKPWDPRELQSRIHVGQKILDYRNELELTKGSLEERVKELKCIYAIADVIEREERLEKILQGSVDIIPNGWMYPGIACARINFRGQYFQTANFRETEWKQAAVLSVDGFSAGVIELCYLEECPVRDEGPFLAEERRLINKIAERLGKVAARKKVEADLRHLSYELVHMERVQTMGALATSLAHELNQPLMGIMSNAQAAQRLLAAETPDLNEIREIVADIIADDKRAGEVIRRQRALLRKDTPECERVDIHGAILEVIDIVRNDAAIRNVLITAEIDKILPEVFADRVQLQQVVMNLILNAGQAMDGIPPAERRIVVRAFCETPDGVTVSVRDNGSGVGVESLSKIFTPFYTTKRDGLGMGLGICKSIVESHGGRIWLENNPDRGARACFVMPAVEVKS